MDLSGIFAIIGCVAILVAVIGGGVEVEKIKIPKLGIAIRIGSALVGKASVRAVDRTDNPARKLPG